MRLLLVYVIMTVYTRYWLHCMYIILNNSYSRYISKHSLVFNFCFSSSRNSSSSQIGGRNLHCNRQKFQIGVNQYGRAIRSYFKTSFTAFRCLLGWNKSVQDSLKGEGGRTAQSLNSELVAHLLNTKSCFKWQIVSFEL